MTWTRLSLLSLLLSTALVGCGQADDAGDETGAGGGAGATGVAGSPGAAGRGGSTGIAGAPGVAGAGPAGSSGKGGSTGDAGSSGVAGTSGPAGAPGRGGAGGLGGMTGGAGTPGRGGTTGVAGGQAGAPGTGGKAGSGGAPGAGGSGSKAICSFASGLNIAWVNFANDVPNPNIAAFNTIFTNTYAAGGRVIRWWFHTNGTKTPGYASDGTVLPIQQSHKDGVKAILDAAASKGVQIVISLWSFDMLQDNAGTAHTNNSRLLEEDKIRQSYIDNYLTPLVTFTKGHPGLYAYEIFNEPEGMSPSGWATYRTTQAAIQKCVNWFIDAIRAADPDVFVTTSAQTFDYCSNGISGKSNWYSDSALRSVGGRQNGVLDFYQVHYYTSNGASNSAFTNAASHWGLTDKKLVMGEFYARDTDGTARADLYTKLYSSGYHGAWGWQYNDGDTVVSWPTMQLPMQNVYNAHMTEVGSCKR
jgi:hypothetical protein